MLVVKVETDNAAFGETDDELRYEASYVLRNIADWIDEGCDLPMGKKVMDHNGNTIGKVTLKKGDV